MSCRGYLVANRNWWAPNSPIPGVSKLKPGSATQPYFGIDAAIVDDDGNVLEGECEGKLCILDSWPGQMRTVYGDHQRFIDTILSSSKENILQEMDVEEIKMVFIGLLEG